MSQNLLYTHRLLVAPKTPMTKASAKRRNRRGEKGRKGFGDPKVVLWLRDDCAFAPTPSLEPSHPNTIHDGINHSPVPITYLNTSFPHGQRLLHVRHDISHLTVVGIQHHPRVWSCALYSSRGHSYASWGKRIYDGNPLAQPCKPHVLYAWWLRYRPIWTANREGP